MICGIESTSSERRHRGEHKKVQPLSQKVRAKKILACIEFEFNGVSLTRRSM